MRYTHTNLDSKRAAVAKLSGLGDNLVTVAPKCSNLEVQLSRMARLLPECVRIGNGGVGERLKPAVLKFAR